MAGAHDSQGTEESCLLSKAIIAYWYHMSMITCKWLGCYGMEECLLELAPGKRKRATRTH